MKISELIKKLEQMDQDKEVILGVEGYSTYIPDDVDVDTPSGCEEIGVYDTDSNYVYICDGCYYEEVDD